MAINPTTNSKFTGRITAATAEYPYGSAKDETSPGAGDGSPHFKARADDIFGFQQALLRSANIIPSGNADTALLSEYFQSIVEQAAGRATLFDETGAVDAYVLEPRGNQQQIVQLFHGRKFIFTVSADNTGPSTVDLSLLLGEPLGTTIKNIKLPDGGDPAAGAISGRTELVYDAVNDWFELIVKSAAGNSVIAVGSITALASNIEPEGWLECDGSALSRVVYFDLFNIIGTTFGVGDGSTTFNLPDLRGDFIRGWDNGRGVDAARAFGSFQEDDFESHIHSVQTNFFNIGAVPSGTSLSMGFLGTANGSVGSTGGDETRPRNIALMYCIKY